MQQMILKIALEHNSITADYNRAVLSYIKSAVQAYNNDIFESWFGKGKTKRKSYTFSVLFPQPKFEKGRIKLHEARCTIYLSAYDLVEYITLYNALLAKRNVWYPVGDNKLLLLDLVTAKIPFISSTSMLVKADSPILARKHSPDNQDKYLTFEDEEFSKAILETIQCATDGLDIPTAGFFIEPVQPKKTVIYHYGMCINANIGIFKIGGSPELLNYLLLAGIGTAANSGHGKIHAL